MAIIVFCLVGTLAACSAKQPANFGIADADITTGVEADLAADSRFSSYDLTVSTDDGKVHLSGLVRTDEERNAAATLASASHGVVSVDNYIRFGK